MCGGVARTRPAWGKSCYADVCACVVDLFPKLWIAAEFNVETGLCFMINSVIFCSTYKLVFSIY